VKSFELGILEFFRDVKGFEHGILQGQGYI
jgi:hypothetical protein